MGLALGFLFFFVLPLAVALWVLSCIYREARRDRVPILLYHRLIRRSDAASGAVPDDEMIWVSYDDLFERQMAHLREAGYQTLDFDEYLEIRAGRSERPERPVIVSFDDGYESNYTLAYPALRKHGLKATIFVAPEPDARTRALVEGVDGSLTPDQMRELAANGVSIQSHSLTHALLTELSEDEVWTELTESRRRLAAITGRPVDHLAIPRAGYDRSIRRLAKRAGYRTVCCNNKGSASGLSSPLALPRIVIERDMDVEEFARSLEPRAAILLRIVGNLKRIPERLGGAAFARRVRERLYGPRWRGLFKTSTLKRVVAVGGLSYGLIALAFWIHVVRS